MPGMAALLALSAAAAAAPAPAPLPLVDYQVHSAAPAPIAQGDDSETLDARTDREKRMTVPVQVGENGPFDFLIDTGSQNTVFSRALADRLALRAGPRVQIIGIADVQPADTAYVDALDLGKITLSSLYVPLLEEQHMGAEGILGTDALQDRRVLLDFARNRVEVGASRDLGGNSGYEIVVQAKRRSGQLIMTDARIDGIAVDVVLDTGGGNSIGNRALQAALGKRGRPSQQVSLLSVTGQSVIADMGLARKLEIDAVQVTNLLIAFTDTPAFNALNLTRKPALFLGMREMRLFTRVAIDFSTRKLLFDVPAGL
jgi:predicted aspartyl protease